MLSLTIGVPVYNAEQYFPACLDSILAQTIPCERILLIDDGSTDRSGAICDEYAGKDTRIRVVHQKNQGVSVARNAIIALCETDYVWFVDADDRIAPNAATLIGNAAKTKPDLILFGMAYDGKTLCPAAEMAERRLVESEMREARAQNIYYRDDSPLAQFHIQSVWSSVFRTELLRAYDLSFPVGMKSGEDTQFVGNVLTHVETIVCLDAKLYFYRPNPGSITRRFSADYPAMLEQTLAACEQLVYTQYSNDPLLCARLNQRALASVRWYLHLYACHAHNPAPYRARRDAFLRYMDSQRIRAAMPEIRSMPQNASDRVLYYWIRRKNFFALNAFYRTLTAWLNRKRA